MKYIIGASIGGLFGLSVPMMLEHPIDDTGAYARVEDPSPPEEDISAPINGALLLPDNFCGHIDYKSDNIEEQAKECLSYSLPAVPAI